jgi:hypothetical protein
MGAKIKYTAGSPIPELRFLRQPGNWVARRIWTKVGRLRINSAYFIHVILKIKKTI